MLLHCVAAAVVVELGKDESIQYRSKFYRQMIRGEKTKRENVTCACKEGHSNF